MSVAQKSHDYRTKPPPFCRIHHIGIAVHDLENALMTYQCLLGLTQAQVREVPERKVRVALFPVGESALELVEPTAPDSLVSEFLERRGEGLYHLALEVDNIKAMLDLLKERGVQLIDEMPRQGVIGSIAFVDPRSTHGVLLELVEREVKKSSDI